MRVFALTSEGRIVAKSANVVENVIDRRLSALFDGPATGDAVENAVARCWLSGDEREVMITDDVLRVMRLPPGAASMVAWAKPLAPPVNHGLTPMELRVMRLFIRGDATPKEIARQLRIDPRTVNDHKNAAIAKLGCRNLGSAAAFMVEHGLL